MTKQIARTAYYGSDIKQCFTVAEHPTDSNGRLLWPPQDEREVLLGMCAGQLRIRYPTRHKKVHYLEEASNDLKCLGVLLIGGLVPAGVFADALGDSMPVHKQAADILRLWGQVRQENQQ